MSTATSNNAEQSRDEKKARGVAAPGFFASVKTDQFTMFLRFFSGMARTFLEAGFALNIIFSPVNGLTPSRALVAFLK